jgi:hypothetical protein
MFCKVPQELLNSAINLLMQAEFKMNIQSSTQVVAIVQHLQKIAQTPIDDNRGMVEKEPVEETPVPMPA